MTIEGASKVLREVVAPLVEADGGELYLVALQATSLEIHLAGACSGCPGANTTLKQVIEPLVRSSGYAGQIRMTTGANMPANGERVIATPRRSGDA